MQDFQGPDSTGTGDEGTRGHTDKITYSPAEAAAVLGVTRQTIYAMIKRGELRRYKVGRCAKLNAREVRGLVGES